MELIVNVPKVKKKFLVSVLMNVEMIKLEIIKEANFQSIYPLQLMLVHYFYYPTR